MLNVQSSQLRSSLERARIFYLMMLSLACLFLPSLAGASERCGSVDRIKIAFRLTEAIYPETKNREFDVSLGNGYSGPPSCPTDGRAVMITVTKDSWLLFEKPDSKTEEYFSHPSDERQRTQELMQSHPDWTAEEALAAARNGGLRFGPSDEGKLLRQLPLKELGEIYGSLRIQRVEFTLMREHEKDAEWWFTELEWDISAKVRGTNKTLQMTVDPFTGRIFALHFFPR